VASQGQRLVAFINPDYFSNSFDLLLKDTGLRAALLQLDRRVVAASESLALPLGLAPSTEFSADVSNKPFDAVMGVGLAGDAVVTAHRAARLAPWVVVVEEPQHLAEASFMALATEAFVVWLVCVGVMAVATKVALQSAQVRELQRLARQQARRDLDRQQRLTMSLIDATATALYAKDGDGRLLLANKAWADLMQVGRAPLLGKPLPDALNWADPPAKAADGAQRPGDAKASNFEVQMPDGMGVKDLLVSKVSVTDESGQVVAEVSSLTDISAYREAERRSREAAEAARLANEAKSEFIANMSHELRTPLQSILGFSEIGMLRAKDSPAALGYFKRVHDAGKQMLGLVENLLDLSKPEVAFDVSQHEHVNLGPLLVELVDEMSPHAESKRIQLALHGLDVTVAAAIDRQALKQVLRHVLSNALQYAPADSTIDLALQAKEGLAQVSVSDRGPGVPAAELESIFEPFVQGSLTKTQAGGTGLGLTISRRLMKAMGGRIGALQREGGGATFIMEWPIA
jgi:signal transduction histidine kinase